jgi:MFS family permease
MTAETGLRAYRGLPGPFWRLWTAALVNRLGTFVVPFLAIFLESERGLRGSEAGLVVATFGAGAICAGPLGGALADRIGRRRTIAAGMALAAFALGGVLAARTPVEIALAALLLGLAHELPRPAMSAMVSDLVPLADRPRAFGALYWAANLGFALAGLLAGLAALASFTWLFVIDGATSLACAAIVLFTLRETYVPGTEARTEARDRSVLRSMLGDAVVPFRDPAFVRFFLVSLLVALVFFQFHVAMPLDMRAHGIDASTYGVLVAINGGLVVVLQPFVGTILDRMRRPNALALAALLTGLGFGLFGTGSGVALYALGIIVLTLGEILMAPISPVVVSELAPARLRGAYQGGFNVAMSLAACAAPILGTTVLEAFGGRALWGGCFVLGLVAAAVHRAGAIERAPALATPIPVSSN